MTQVSAVPQSMPGIAPVQAVAATGANGTPAEAEGTVDFAAVLQAQLGQPAKDASAAEILAALLPAPTAEEVVPEASADLPAVSPDMSALLPALAALLPAAAAVSPAGPPESRQAPSAGNDAATPAVQPLATPLAASSVAQPDQASDDVPAGAELPAARQMPGAATPAVQAEAVAPPTTDLHMPTAAAEPAVPTTAAHAAPSAHIASPGGDAAAIRVDTPAGSRGWDAEVGQKIVLLVNRQESRAELTLTPPQLGRVEVSISVNGDQTSAAFVSASPAAREALEQALPRLREILADAGITLGQASVNAESARQGREETPAGPQRGSRNIESAGAVAPSQWLRRSEGLIDTFA